MPHIATLSAVRVYLARNNVEAFVVGGYVRDILLGRHTADIDIAVRGDSLEVCRNLARELGGTYVLLDEANRVGRVALDLEVTSLCVDVSGYEADINTDLARRDFTVNAMAVGIGRLLEERPLEHLVDPFGGREDIRDRKLRAVSAGIFRSDPGRLLRAVRLSAELAFDVEEATEALIKRDAALLGGVSGERVREELAGMLSMRGSARLVERLDALGLLLSVFPELGPARGFVQGGEHYWEVLEHSKKTVAAAEYLTRQGDWEYVAESVLAPVPWSGELEAHFALRVAKDSSRSMLLKLAALLHDVAKPQTRTEGEQGRGHFLGHAKLGADMARRALERLRFSAREVGLVETAVFHHLRPAQMTQEELPTRRAIFRYFRDTAGAGVDIFFLSMADYLATRGPRLTADDWRQHMRLMEYVFEERERQAGVAQTPRVVDGHDIMEVFGIGPGPEVGVLLRLVQEAEAAGEISTREEALELVRGRIAAVAEGKIIE